MQLGEPAPVGDLGLLVEHLARVTQTADMNSRLSELLISARQAVRRLTCLVLLALACNPTSEIEHVEFGRWMTQQVANVPESLGVLKTKGFSAVADGPILALFAENRLPGRGGVLNRGCHGGFVSFTMLSLRFHLIALSSCKASMFKQ